MKNLRNLIWLALALLLSACSKPEPLPFQNIDISWRFHQTPDFQLTDHHGQLRKLSDFDDRVKVLFFGYTHCPEVCPTTLADLSVVMRKLGPDAARVQVLFVSLDPERDTQEKLSLFVPSFYPDFLGLRGDQAATDNAAKLFGVSYERHPSSSGYTLDHSDGTYLISSDRKTVVLARYNQQADIMVHDIRLLLGVK